MTGPAAPGAVPIKNPPAQPSRFENLFSALAVFIERPQAEKSNRHLDVFYLQKNQTTTVFCPHAVVLSFLVLYSLPVGFYCRNTRKNFDHVSIITSKKGGEHSVLVIQ
jgi:hypothetical protein